MIQLNIILQSCQFPSLSAAEKECFQKLYTHLHLHLHYAYSFCCC